MSKKKIADIIKVDGSIERLPTTVAKMDLSAVQKIVGGYIEHVGIQGVGDLWCNEEGLLQGLPINHAATQLTGMPVVGDVIIERRGEIT